MSWSGGTVTPMSDTSKSTSSKSYESETTERKIDFTSDNAKSLLDIESIIQTERITKILDGLISRTKTALCIPSLMNDSKILQNVLTPQHLEDVEYIVAQYEADCAVSSVNNVYNPNTIEDMKTDGVGIKTRMNPELGHLLFILHSYPELKKKMDEIITKMVALQNEERNPAVHYLITLNQFRNQMARQMTSTAADELKMKIRVMKHEVSNAMLIKKIQRYTVLLSEELQQFDQNYHNSKEKIIRFKQECDSLQIDAAAQLKKQILDSERQMVLMSRKHDVDCKLLQEEEADTVKNYNNILQEHMSNEKTQRLRRFKVETQLITWIQKYDLEMSEKDAEYLESKKMYNEEMEKVKQLQETLANQDLEYNELMAEKEKEYAEEMNRKLKECSINHAARVLQVAWKRVLENRTLKIKMKKTADNLRMKVETETRKREKAEMLRVKQEKLLARKNKKNK